MKNLFLLILIPFYSFSQTDNYEKAVIETATGAYIIFSSDSNSISIHLDTASVKVIDNPQTVFLNVDNKWILQLFALGYENPQNKDINDVEVQKSFILQYFDYEKKYFTSELNMTLTNLQTYWGDFNGKHFLFWHFETPEIDGLQKQLFMTTLCYDHFLNINVPVMADDNLTEAEQFIKKVASLVRTHSHKIDIEKLYNEVNGM